MKNTLIILFVLLCIQSFAQINPDAYKSLRQNSFKSDINIYYNPQMDDYNIHFVKLDLEVTDQSTYISGNATIIAKTVASLDTLIFDFSSYLSLDSVLINDEKVEVSHTDNTLQYIFDTPLNDKEEFKAQIYYHGTPDPNGGGVTHDYDEDNGKNLTWTLSESFHAMEWWPCKQVLSDKIDSAYIFLTCDDDCMAGSNGLLTNVASLPDNKKRFEWITSYPINYYLISFAVAEYQDYSIYAKPDGVDSVLIQNFVYNNANYLSENKETIDKTIDMLELFSEKFGLYPFANEKYGHCLTTLGGGMEHQTMTTIGSLSEEWYNIISHELGHMWFGDYVTCASWQDIWINEGFASYTEYVALENLKSYADAQAWMETTHNYALEEPNHSIYIPFEWASDEGVIFYFRLSYKKGAAIVHMLRHEVNDDDLFFISLRNYLAEYGDSVATGEDFKNSLESSTDLDFDLFFDQWYYGKGYPYINVDYTQENDTLFMNVTQTTTSSETPLFQLHVDYKLIFDGGDTTIRLYQSKNAENYKIPFEKTVSNIVIDPDNWVLNLEGTANYFESPDNNKTLFSLGPNPATENINLTFNYQFYGKLKQIKIFNLSGQLIRSYQSNEDNYAIDISFLPRGIYLLKGSSGNKSCTYKLIKQ